MLAGLSQLTALGAVRLSAALKGVAGFTGAGVVRYSRRANGRWRLDADIEGIAGLKAELVVNGSALGPLACRDGAASGRFDSTEGAPVPALSEGDTIEIHQNGVAVLKGVLACA